MGTLSGSQWAGCSISPLASSRALGARWGSCDTALLRRTGWEPVITLTGVFLLLADVGEASLHHQQLSSIQLISLGILTSIPKKEPHVGTRRREGVCPPHPHLPAIILWLQEDPRSECGWGWTQTKKLTWVTEPQVRRFLAFYNSLGVDKVVSDKYLFDLHSNSCEALQIRQLKVVRSREVR